MSTAPAPGTPWEERATADGSWTLWNSRLGEGCHSEAGAWQQARERYALGCRLDAFPHAPRPFRLLDVGTGLGLNLAAALWALEPTGAALEACSLELDPAVITRGLALYARAELVCGPWERWHRPVRAALAAALEAPGTRVPLAGAGGLELRLGDARATLGELTGAGDCDAVFLDPFSPRKEGALWSEDFLRRVAARLAPEGWLATYSASFAVRLALVRAGLRVGRGPRVGAKSEGTLASPGLDPPAFAPRLARRLERRKAPLEAP